MTTPPDTEVKHPPSLTIGTVKRSSGAFSPMIQNYGTGPWPFTDEAKDIEYLPASSLSSAVAEAEAKGRREGMRHLEEWVQHDCACSYLDDEELGCNCGLAYAFQEIADAEAPASRGAQKKEEE